ncbi:hypothetical protein NVT68_012100 [Clostridium botulinum]|uniref:hypothetical protein n=1 Tax=Clostridium TaxID=1485 RepID=UPI001560DC07|nr:MULTISPECIES: hypothetical protein [Clostridium]MDI6920375.1 hypothetical protein [Clostridium botulinum]
MNIMIGKATPTPAIANSPLGILPINILSTMLYFIKNNITFIIKTLMEISI